MLNEFGPLGQTVFDVILRMVYKNGYYYEFPSLDKLSLKVLQTIGNRWANKNSVSKVIRYCADIGLFDDVLLSRNVITSLGIQRRYKDVTARNKVDKSKYWLLENEEPLKTVPENDISATEKPISATEKPISATEKTQENIREDNIREDKITYQQIADMFNETCVSFPRVTALSEKRKKAIKARLNSGYTIEDFKRLFAEAEKSSFLKGKNNRDWQATFDWLISDGNMVKVLDGNYRDKDKPPDGKRKASYDIAELEKRLEKEVIDN